MRTSLQRWIKNHTLYKCHRFASRYFPSTCSAISYMQPSSLIYLWLFLREEETHLALSVLWILLSCSAALRGIQPSEPATRMQRIALRIEAFASTYLALGTIASSLGVRRIYAGWISIWCVLIPPPLIKWAIGNDWAQCARSSMTLFASVDLLYQFLTTLNTQSLQIHHAVWRSLFCTSVRAWRYRVHGRPTLLQDLVLVWHLKSSGLW